MRIIRHIILFVFILHTVAGAIEKPFTRMYIYNTSNADVRCSYTFDANLNQTEEFIERFIDSSWVKSSRVVSIYYMSGALKSSTLQMWADSIWKDLYRSELTIDENSRCIEREYFTIDMTKNRLLPSNKTYYSYSDNGLIIQEIRQKYKDTTYIFYNKISNKYDSKDSLVQTIVEGWSNNDWVFSSKTTNDYDDNGNLTLWSCYNWNGSDWEHTGKYERTYDTNNNLIEKKSSMVVEGSWTKLERYLYSYNERNLTAALRHFKAFDNEWSETGRASYEYNEAGQVTEIKSKNWADSLWYDVCRDIYTYDDGGNLLEKKQILFKKNDGWVNNFMFSYSFKDSMKSTIAYFTWVNGKWKETDNNLTFNDHKKNFLTQNAYRLEFEYDAISEVNETTESFETISVCPNPARDYICIYGSECGSEYRICDIKGNLIKSGVYSDSIDISELSTGVYIIFIGGRSQMFIKS